MSKIFQINFNKLVLLLLPTFLRKPRTAAFIQSAVTPVKILYADFSRYRTANLYTLANNGQVCYLRRVLNDRFDPEQRRIRIADGNRFKRVYIYTRGEQKPKYLGKIYLRQREDYADTGVDFRVIVPKGFDMATQIHQLRATIDFYKLASKRYKIEYEQG